jgi:hypothetical protein
LPSDAISHDRKQSSCRAEFSAVTSSYTGAYARGELTVFSGIEAALYLYSAAGPYATLGYQGEAAATLITNEPTCKLTYGPHAEAGMKPVSF